MQTQQQALVPDTSAVAPFPSLHRIPSSLMVLIETAPLPHPKDEDFYEVVIVEDINTYQIHVSIANFLFS